MRSQNTTAPTQPSGGVGDCPSPAPALTAVLTRAECADWLGISTRHLARLDVPYVKLGRLVRYSVQAVLRWIEQGGRV